MTKINGPEVSYCDLLDHEIIEKIEKDKVTYNTFPLRPSAAGSCSRKLGYELMEYQGKAKYDKENMDPTTYRLLNLGSSVEYHALRNLELLPGFKLKYKQQSVTLFRLPPIGDNQESPLVEGSMDVVLWSDDFKCVLDVKSQKDGFSQSFKSRWEETLYKYDQMTSLQKIGKSAWYAENLEVFLRELGDDFLTDNLVQLNLYACSQFLRERGVDHAVIYKYNKNDSRHYEIRFKPSMEVFRQTETKFNNVWEKVNKNQVEQIERNFNLGSMRCAFCPYSKVCWDENGKEAWFKTFKEKQWPTDVQKLGPEATQLLQSYIDFEKKDKDNSICAESLLKILVAKGINKVRLNEHIYEVKHLKSPRPHYELRRSKL